jgi:hypothetical protein
VNKTLITLGFLILILGAIIGNVVLAILRPEQLATFNGSMITILGVGTAGIVTIWGLGQQGDKLKRIESNTNGTLSRLTDEKDAALAEAARLRETLAATGSTPTSGEHLSQ